jgi:hypothetical protein
MKRLASPDMDAARTEAQKLLQRAGIAAMEMP